MTRALIFFAGLFAMVVAMGYAAGYHIVYAPTPDQLYGCNAANQAPNGECE